MGYGVERIDQEGGIPWLHNIIQPVLSYWYIFHPDANNSAMAVPHLAGHHVNVEENGSIPRFLQKLIQGRSARKERTFTQGSMTLQKDRAISVFAEGGMSMR